MITGGNSRQQLVPFVCGVHSNLTDPVLNDLTGWLLRTRRLHRYVTRFECMTYQEEVVVVDERVLKMQEEDSDCTCDCV